MVSIAEIIVAKKSVASSFVANLNMSGSLVEVTIFTKYLTPCADFSSPIGDNSRMLDFRIVHPFGRAMVRLMPPPPGKIPAYRADPANSVRLSSALPGGTSTLTR